MPVSVFVVGEFFFKVLVLIRILCLQVTETHPDLVEVQSHILEGQGYTSLQKLPKSGTQVLVTMTHFLQHCLQLPSLGQFYSLSSASSMSLEKFVQLLESSLCKGKQDSMTGGSS